MVAVALADVVSGKALEHPKVVVEMDHWQQLADSAAAGHLVAWVLSLDRCQLNLHCVVAVILL